MDATTLDLLRELTEAPGLPGHEDAIRRLVARRVAGLAKVGGDRLGSVICEKRGTEDRPRIMIPGHMDECGFLVRGITDEGYLRFSPLGGWWEHVMLAQRVTVHTRNGELIGIVGSKAPHALTAEERNKLVKIEDMFVDVGAKDKKEAMESLGIRPGDPIVPICPFTPMHNRKLLMGKAFDDRLGVALFIDVLRRLAKTKHPNTVYGVGTVQEEVGTRGAQTSVDAIDPDVALVVDVGVASDGPEAKPEVRDRGTLGKGPQIWLSKVTYQVTDKPYQISMLERVTTDGRPIHLHKSGVPTVYIGIATRYIHSHAGIFHADDYDNALRLIVEAVKRMDRGTVSSFHP